MYFKCEKLEFYNDEKDTVIQPPRPPKPRKSMYESQEEFNGRLLEWEASLPHQQEVKPKGNTMTQKYYCDRLLPSLIDAVNTARLWDEYNSDKWLLQEDGDPSHGMRSRGLATTLKEANWITNLPHPPGSPDLNPMESSWNILKQRVRKRTWNTLEELKEIIQDEWGKITQEEVRTRIATMPDRCKLLLESGGKPIKAALW